jgi:hypothetical protein
MHYFMHKENEELPAKYLDITQFINCIAHSL